PANAATGVNLGARLRLTTDTLPSGGAGAGGSASNGEVEDYLLQVSPGGLTVAKSVLAILNPINPADPGQDTGISLGGINEVGDRIVYQVAVGNPYPAGGSSYANVSVFDPLVSLSLDPTSDPNSNGLLDPLETWLYKGTHTFSPADAAANAADADCLQQVEDSLPDQVQIMLTTIGKTYSEDAGIDDSLFDIRVSSGIALPGKTANPFLNGWANGWCLDPDTGIPSNNNLIANVVSSYDLSNPILTQLSTLIDKPENLDMVNWVLNQDYSSSTPDNITTFNQDTIQLSIWKLMDRSISSSALSQIPTANAAGADRIIAAATAAVGINDIAIGYTPGCGDKIGIILQATSYANTPTKKTVFQPVLITVDIPYHGTLTNTALASAIVSGASSAVSASDSVSTPFSIPATDIDSYVFNGVLTNNLLNRNDLVKGSSGNDSFSGANGNDTLIGGSGNDVLNGGSGNDQLTGGVGIDTLTGGGGTNQFVFLSPTEGGDAITDFAAGVNNIISLSNTGFYGELGSPGPLSSTRFATGAFTTNAQRISYSAGTLTFDSNGSDAGGVIATLANLIGAPLLTTSNLMVTA
ncbi:MAG: calcium-binding protein, partial [Synechococcaceae cyanobacterium]